MNFHRDLAIINDKLHELGAVVVCEDGFTFVNESVVPAALLSTYRGLVQYGYANGLI